MALSGVILPEPIWYFVDNSGKPLGAGFFYTFRSLDKTSQKLVFQDPGLTLAFPDPIRISANGVISSPIFWAQDEPYYIEVYSVDPNGNRGTLVWAVDNYSPTTAGGGGGGGTITTVQSVSNYIANNVHYHNLGTSASPIPAGTTLAPGNHEGFSTPDTTIQKDGAAVDQITFVPFALDNNPFAGDVTPEVYLNYICSTPGVESFKFIRYPINLHVNSFENQPVSISIWMQNGSAGTVNVPITIRQYFGQGGSPTASVVTTVTPTAIVSGTWKKYNYQFTIPAIGGAVVLGTCGDDAIFLEVNLPLNSTCNINIAKPSLYLGSFNTATVADFQTYDQIDSIISSPRTGDTRLSYNTFSPFGWVPANDGSIGSVASLATTRANIDTFQLFSLLWNNVSNTYAPVSTGRGASAVADFSANKTLTIPRTLGRAIAVAGSGAGLIASVLGEYIGADTHTITAAELPAIPATPGTVMTNVGPGTGSGGGSTISAVSLSVNAGSPNTPISIIQPTTYQNIFIKL